jgi:Holliday junction resolvase RusA-like endonuclease
VISFFVAGQPGTKGSARAIPFEGKDGRLRASLKNDSTKAKPWAACVSAGAAVAMKGTAPLAGPVEVRLVFHLPRPLKHYRSDGTLKPAAPHLVTTKPDGDKLERCTWDALTGIAFRDDAVIARWSGEKRYTGLTTGCQIEVGPCR